MSKLEWSEVFQRNARCRPLEDLVEPTWDLVKKAIKDGDTGEALELLDYCYFEGRNYYDSLMSMTDTLLTLLAESAGEEAIERNWRSRYSARAIEILARCDTVEKDLQRITEGHRGHFADITMTEEPDRYVIKCDPCGSGGQMRRNVDAGVTKKAYPWTWNKVGVPYYCTHCCVALEILPIEIRGYPVCVIDIADKPEDPCFQHFYKSPDLIPEEYFTRIGKKKDASKFKRG
ncbi:hypothetical protein ACFLTS_07150 [Chloroflexota bacterium]